MPHAATEFLTTIQRALGGYAKSDSRVEFTGEGALPSVFAVTDLAAGSIGAAALAVLAYADAGAAMTPAASVDRRLASFWFGSSVEPIGWSLPPVWDVIAGDYSCADGWIRQHTNAARHRQAALAVLATAGDKEADRTRSPLDQPTCRAAQGPSRNRRLMPLGFDHAANKVCWFSCATTEWAAGSRKQRSFDDGVAWVKGPKAVNHPYQVGLGELRSYGLDQALGKVGGPIGLTRDGVAVWRP
jgi:hypothetical protein